VVQQGRGPEAPAVKREAEEGWGREDENEAPFRCINPYPSPCKFKV
jgi:hypothetical protein